MFGQDLQYKTGLSWRGKWAYRFLGEMYVGDRIRSMHVFRKLREMGLPRAGTQILDAGCGGGAYAFALARYYPTVQITGIEIAENLVGEARVCLGKSGLHNMRFRQGDLTEISEVDAYDLVLCIAVLEHIQDDVEALRAIHRAMKRGGILLIEVPKDTRYAKRHFHKSLSHPNHVRPGYLQEQICSVLHTAGFEIRDVEYLFGFWGSLAWEMGQVMSLSVLQLLAYPFLGFLGRLDLVCPKRDGNGLLITAMRS